MDETKKIWMDGKLIDWKDAKTHVLTHSLHYGGGVFEGIRFYKTDKGTAVFRLKEHVERLFKSAESVEMAIPFTQEEIFSAIVKTVKVNAVEYGYIRPIAFFGYGKMGLNPKGAPVNVAIACWPWGAYLGDEAVKVKTSSYMRIHPKSTKADAKICGHYVNSILASIEAKNAGFEEAILLDYQGNVAEGPGENIFMVKGGKLITPALGNILPGITRSSVFSIARDIGIAVEERKITPQELKGADELFFTGTAAEVSPIGKLDDKTIGNGTIGPITAKIKQEFFSRIKKAEPSGWFALVK